LNSNFKIYFLKNLVFFLLLFVTFHSLSQGLKLTNALIIAQFERPEDRYAIEVNTNDILNNLGIKAQPSLNFLKQGAEINILISDSLQQNLKSKGFDTYLVVNVKGYDRKFKASKSKIPMSEILERISIYSIYRDESSSISFEFIFFKNNEMIFTDIIKVSNISNRDSVLKKYRKVLEARVQKNWLN
jgi:hypothetical protein